MKYRINRFKWPFIIGSALLSASLFTIWTGLTADQQMRTELLRNALLVAQAVDADEMDALLFEPKADLRPDFQHVARHLKQLSTTISVSWDPANRHINIYSMRLQGGRICFGPENIPPDSPEASAPGTVYEKAPSELLYVFKTRQPVIIGPFTDEYGTYVSSFVAFPDTSQGPSKTILGLDIAADKWNLAMIKKAALPAFLGLALIVALVLSAAVYEQYYSLARTKTDLQSSTLRYRQLAAQSRTIAWEVNADGLYTYISQVVENVLGYQPQEIVNKLHFYDLHPEDGRETFKASAFEVFSRKEPFENLENVVLSRDGSPVWISTNGIPLIGPNGRLQGYCGSDTDITARKAAEKAIQEQRRRLEAIIEGANLGTWEWDIQSGATKFNSRWAQMLGYTLDELSPVSIKTWQSLTHPDDLAVSEDLLRRHFTGELPYYDCECRMKHKDGRWVWIHDCGRLISRTADGNPKKMFGTHSDITLRKNAEEALKRANAHLTTILEKAPFGVVIIRKDRSICWANQMACKMAGLERIEELIGKQCSKILCPAQQDQCPVLDLGQTIDHSERVLKPCNGDKIPILKTVIEINLDGEDVLLETFVDLRERKAAEEKLAESQARLDKVVESAQDAIIMLDPEGHVSMWNKSAERIFGYTKEEILGKNLHQLMAPRRFMEDHQKSFAQFCRSGQGGAIGKMIELSALRKNGEEFPIELSLSSVQIKEAWHAVGILRDITDRKMAEDQLQRALSEADALNRNLESQTAYANQLARMAESANVAKSEFLANMSHEIRTPMNGVIGMTGLLLDTQLSPEQRQYAEIINSSGEALLALINDILDFSKIEAGKLELESLEFDLRDLLEEFSSVLAYKAHEKRLEFICAADPKVPSYLKGDPGRLRQILTNLVGNAFKFTEKGEVSVRVSLESSTEKEAVLNFSIQDTGVGIPADQVDKLFTKFTQVDSSTTRKYGGTGLGLAISKQLAEKMDGRIGARSEYGKGTEFWFTARFGLQTARNQVHKKEHGFKCRNILIVDDNKTNREILKVRLKSWGIEAAEAENGPSAVHRLHSAFAEGRPFDAALIDLQMPEMDGMMLGMAIRKEDQFNDMAMILMSSLGNHEQSRDYEDIGFSARMTKPLKFSELYQYLASLNKRSDQPDPGQKTEEGLESVGLNSSARILVVEDNMINQHVTLSMLKKLNLHGEAAVNGKEAIEAARKVPYDLILMDIQMPVMDGIEATQAIRRADNLATRPDVPILALTANVLQGEKEKCMDAGMNDYLPKPVPLKELTEKLQHWLDLKLEERIKPGHKPASDRTSAPVFDKVGLVGRLMGDLEMVKNIIEVFLENVPDQLEKIHQSIQECDADSFTRLVHSLRGAASNVGGEALSRLAAQLESSGGNGTPEMTSETLEKLQNGFSNLKPLLTLALKEIDNENVNC